MNREMEKVIEKDKKGLFIQIDEKIFRPPAGAISKEKEEATLTLSPTGKQIMVCASDLSDIESPFRIEIWKKEGVVK